MSKVIVSRSSALGRSGQSTTPGCVDLQEHFGRRYRIGHDECHQPRRPDPWLLTIECRYGHVYPFGGNLLAASIDGFPKVASRLRELKGAKVHQDGDDGELTAIFDVADLSKVAKIIRPRSRRQLSERQRAALSDRLRAFRETASLAPTGGQYTDQGGDSDALDGSEHVERQPALI